MPRAATDLTGTATGVHCAHCTLPVPAGLLEPEAEAQFCCAGCRTAWHLVREAGLDAYYEFDERRLEAVASSGRSFEEFDHQSFHDLHVRAVRGRILETELYLEGVHCASCVWLVERVPLAVPGALSAELDVGRARARIQWDPSVTPLSAIARFVDRLGYRPHPFRGARRDEIRRRETREMLIRIGVAGALAGNVMMLAAALYAGWFGTMAPEQVQYFRWASLALTTPALLWPGRVFFQGALGALRAKSFHMDLPVAIALATGFGRGAVNTITGSGPIYFDGVATLIFFLLVGRYLQQRAQRAATDSAELLYGLAPSNARLIDGDETRTVPSEALLPGCSVLVQAGETIPADGAVALGRSTVDLSLLTGESLPVEVEPGVEVFAGTVNLSGTLTVQVTHAGMATRLGRVLRDVEAGAARRAPIVRLADRLAGGFVAVVLALAAITWLLWRAADPHAAVDHAIALLIITCPCALALATPLAMTVSIGRAAKRGILIRGGDALEALARPGRLMLDKTGTVTEGRLALEHFEGAPATRAWLLGLEREASHPLAAAIRSAWPDLVAAEVDDVRHTVGGGLTGRLGVDRLVVGSPGFVLPNATDPEGMARRIPSGLTPVLLARGARVVAAMGFGDPIRPGAAHAIRILRRRGWSVGLLSGDASATVAFVGRQLGLEREAIQGGATPEAKLAAIAELSREAPVVMVGDGVNDAAAIARATVGIGVHGGAEASLAAADVYLARPGLEPLVELIDGAGSTRTVIRAAIGFSLAYNLVGAALAMAGMVTPLLAAVLMPASSLTVLGLALRGRPFTAER
ncbi:MAG: heavy metal translocating P-type ATPase metal-binding domain-containing protein [Gemmatimonadales bacterium]